MEIHKSSLDTFNALYCNLDGLERYRILEDISKYVINGLPSGDMLEIGVGESSFYLSRVAREAKRRIYHCDIAASKILNPLSVSGYLANEEEYTYFAERDSTPDSLKRIVLFAGASDDLFTRLNIKKLAFSFIDGDHSYLQTKKDFWNIVDRTVDNGVIALHDTYPPDLGWTDENHCGEVWRLRREIEVDNRFDCFTFTAGCVIGVGLTIVRKRPEKREIFQ